MDEVLLRKAAMNPGYASILPRARQDAVTKVFGSAKIG
jgi:hypothetical protein